MTPREIIIRNIEFRGPERIGMAFGGGRMNDFCQGSGLGQSSMWKQKRWSEDGFEYYDDEWGNIWRRVEGKSAKGEIFRPVLSDWANLKNLKIPDFDAPYRYEGAKKAFRRYPHLYRGGGLPGFPFAICRYLRRMDVYLQDLILEKNNINTLHETVTDMLEKVILRWAEAGADSVGFAEDWGTQTGLLISPRMWREIFKPLYARLCAAARGAGMHVHMHSCGYNREILEDLADVGINCLQFDQPVLYDLEELSAVLKTEKVCLSAPVDIQRVLPSGDTKLIEENALRMINLFGKPRGGFIAGGYGDLKGAGISEEADEAAYRTFYENMHLHH